MNQNNIFVDTNILIGAYAGSQADTKALRHLYSLRGKRLYTSSLSIAQLASVFQKRKPNNTIKKIIEKIQAKFCILDFTNKDITGALKLDNIDIEDSMQYVTSAKPKCLYFVTNNKKDYMAFNTIVVLKPTDVRTIE